MSYIEPNTTLKILKGIPFDPDYENTGYFHTLGEQELYFLGHAIKSVDYMTYQRRERNVIRVGWVSPANNPVIKELYNANYMMFKNSNYENKWFYAFILNVEYVNNNTVDIVYKLDFIQSWFFEVNFNQCFIERTHTVTDNIGDHTVPEQLEHGPYFEELANYAIDNTDVTNGLFNFTPAVCLITTFDAQGDYCPGTVITGKTSLGNMFSGLYYTIYQLTPANVTALNNTLENITDRALVEGVVALFMLPWEFANSIAQGPPAPAKSLTFDIRTTVNNVLGYHIGNYRPRNKKLLCYPYNMLYISNNQGGEAELRWENFATYLGCVLSIWGNASTTPALSCTPINYNGVIGENYEQRLEMSGFPMVGWANDAYKAWLAQNAGSIASYWFNTIPNAIQAAANKDKAGTLDLIAGGTSLLTQTLSGLGEMYDHWRKPPQARGNTNASIQYQQGLMTFAFYRKHIKEEYAKIIDSFFDMYGYRVNTVGTPVRMTRQHYTYIKTVGCVIDGNIPASDILEIEKIHDRGIRYWHTSDANFGNYNPSVNPNEVTIQG